MTGLFDAVLRMSGCGTVAALAAALVTLLFRRARCSKTALLLLWAVAAFRLACPWSPPSPRQDMLQAAKPAQSIWARTGSHLLGSVDELMQFSSCYTAKFTVKYSLISGLKRRDGTYGTSC